MTSLWTANNNAIPHVLNILNECYRMEEITINTDLKFLVFMLNDGIVNDGNEKILRAIKKKNSKRVEKKNINKTESTA